MIDYSETKRGDILRLVPPGAPEYAELGDLVRVTEASFNGVMVEDRDGNPCEFVFNCGAARLEPTEWRADFPPKPPASFVDVDLVVASPKVSREVTADLVAIAYELGEMADQWLNEAMDAGAQSPATYATRVREVAARIDTRVASIREAASSSGSASDEEA